ncbi:winged helix-turn-helix domain-containing protein [Klebsiella oxytoca]|uniref:winged helix-turn-helix domain-containing protein n=1 Tax=Klebsiella oxytoca TaxID=571 RepID=UPI003570BC35
MSNKNESPVILVTNISSNVKEVIYQAVHNIHHDIFSCQDKDVLKSIEKLHPALILINVHPPGSKGLILCKQIRYFYELPIIMLSTKSKEATRLAAFELDVDDYITGVSNPRELALRLKAVLRRCKTETIRAEPDNVFWINRDTRQVFVNGVELDITRSEYRILFRLSSSPGQVFTREQLCRCLNNENKVSLRVIDCHIKNLRTKLSIVRPDILFIKSTYGLGYSWQYK